MLGKADSLRNFDVLAWAEYFLLGLKNEIEKIDSLLNIWYVREKILIPTLSFALKNEHIIEQEFKILQYILLKDDMIIKSEELEKFGITNSLKKSRLISKLRKKNIIRPIKQWGRIYTINFANNHLLRWIIKSLTSEGFVSDFLN